MAMTKKEIMEAIKNRAFSQEFYAFLYQFFKEHPEALERFEKQNLKNSDDMFMRLEGKEE